MSDIFYITTPIYYPDAETPPLGDEMEGVSVGIPPRSAGLHVNDNPHIGHTDTRIPVDALGCRVRGIGCK